MVYKKFLIILCMMLFTLQSQAICEKVTDNLRECQKFWKSSWEFHCSGPNYYYKKCIEKKSRKCHLKCINAQNYNQCRSWCEK